MFLHNQDVTISNGGPFIIGSRATPRCISNFGVADRIEWRSSEGDVLVSGTSISYLELVLDPVNDSLSVHGAEFTCFIIRDEGMANETVSNQKLPVTVIGMCVCIKYNAAYS